jgi:Sulfotransferase domain
MNLLPLRARRWLRRTFVPDREHRVDFLIAGAQKGGTNTLDYWLRSHPAIAMAERKEVRYFNDDRLHRNGHPDYAHYHAWFARSAFERMTGEASPVYLYWKPAIERIHRYNPAMKFILLLRDPVDRAYSSWNMQRQRGVESRSFVQAVAEELPRLFDPTAPQHPQFDYLARSLYGAQLARLLEVFPVNQVLVMRSDELKTQPQACFDRVCSFLGVTPQPLASTGSRHVRSYEASLDSEQRKRLQQVFEPDIHRLEAMLGWDCSAWLR